MTQFMILLEELKKFVDVQLPRWIELCEAGRGMAVAHEMRIIRDNINKGKL